MANCTSRADHFSRMGGWLDSLGSIPAVPGWPSTSLLHLARLNQVVRIVRHLRHKDREEMIEESRQAPTKTALLTITIAAFVLITIASLFMLRLEKGAPGASIQTRADAFWWAMVTITTVGYGDYVPVTLLRRIVAMVVLTFGIGVFAVLTSFAATRLIGMRYDGHQDDWEEVIETIREENAIIRAELAELKELLKQQATMDDDEV